MVEQSNRQPRDDIELRVKPRPVRRINRKILMGGTALFSVLLFGAVWFALNPPDFRRLPSTYDAIPKLGPPLPGDFGDALRKVEIGKGGRTAVGRQAISARPRSRY